ncbi:MAG: peptidoglycan-binding domain-containing protein [Candidatus Omnitrophota bacterium]
MEKAMRVVVLYSLSLLLLPNVLGCAATRGGSKGTQVQGLQARVCELEKQVQDKDEEISDLEDELMMAKVVKTAKTEKRITAKRSKTLKRTPRNIQSALKNADVYKGPVDGKIGKGTKKSIREFQKNNGLTEDGIVGKKTWMALKKYL